MDKVETQNENKEYIKKKNSAYYAINKEQVKEHNKERVVCRLCDKNVCRGALRTHMKSNLCKKEQDIQKLLREMGKI